MSKPPIGLDFGARSLKVAAGNRLIATPMPAELVKDGRIVSMEAMAAFLKETLRKEKVSGRHAAIVLPPSLTMARRITLPAMTVDQLELNLPYEFRDYITGEKNQYVYDYALMGMETGEDGKPIRMELMTACARKSTIQDYADLCHRAGLKLMVAAPVEFAWINLLRQHIAEDPEAAGRTIAVADLGHGATKVYLFTGDRLEAARVIEIGGAHMDRALGESIALDAQAATVRKEANLDDELDSEAVRAVYSRIAVEVMRAMNFYAFNHPDIHVEQLLVCGGGARNPALLAELESTLEGLPLEGIDAILPQALRKQERAGDFAGAYGIAQT